MVRAILRWLAARRDQSGDRRQTPSTPSGGVISINGQPLSGLTQDDFEKIGKRMGVDRPSPGSADVSDRTARTEVSHPSAVQTLAFRTSKAPEGLGGVLGGDRTSDAQRDPSDMDQVDLRRRLLIIPARQAKAGATLSIPLSQQAVALLKRQKRVKDQPRVFLWSKGPIEDANHEAFRAARVRAGVPWCRWHDLRHTWASWHVQRGTPLNVIQALGGWASLRMVQNYAHLNPQALRFHVEHRKGIPERSKRA